MSDSQAQKFDDHLDDEDPGECIVEQVLDLSCLRVLWILV